MALTFLRWLRLGMAASYEVQQQPPTSAARGKLQIGVEVGASTGGPGAVDSIDIDLLGPADVAGIDPRQVIDMFPRPGTRDFEPAYLVHVEFDRPDLPWMFTPHGRSPSGTLAPWICLVVVEKGERSWVEPAEPLPRLVVEVPEVARLPKLADVHAWAHVQITGETATGAEAIAANEPDRILSRLVCPRELDPDRSYLACVVPTFKAGALAGLGQAVPATADVDAWSTGDQRVELPVYHHWELSTGGAGDFRALVQRLEPSSDLPGVGTRELDVTEPGFDVADRSQETRIDLGGALRVDKPAEPPVDADLAVDLEPLLNATDTVAPPIYGRWHAAAEAVKLPAAGKPLGWLEALNFDQRHRVAAGLGTLVVQERQEDLMAAIWEQLGELLRANQLLRQAQLAVAASERVLARHLTGLPDATLLSLVGPALARIRLQPGETARKAVAESCLPVLALSGAFRRVVRAHGPLDRRLIKRSLTGPPDVALPPAIDGEDVVEALASGSLAPPPIRLPDGALAVPSTPSAIRLPGPGREVLEMRDRPEIPSIRELTPHLEEAEADPLGELAPELVPALATLRSRSARAACTGLEIGPVASVVRDRLDPDVAVAGRARRRVKLPPTVRVHLSSRLDPIMAAPEIPTPMIGPLLELGTEWLLPGIEELPPNTVAIVEPNPEFIEAYMVGLNHEIGREMLWRGFPTDQRGTVFSRFWDRRGSVPSERAPVPDRDLPPIHEWDGASALGQSLTSGGRRLVVLLMRGDLLERYPRPNIYLQRGRWVRDPRGAVVFDDDLALRSPVELADARAWDADARFPLFRGDLGSDVEFLGFPLGEDEVRGVDRGEAMPDSTDEEAGWYVVFEEHPTGPRFGPASAPTPLLADTLAPALMRRAYRLFVHAGDLVPA